MVPLALTENMTQIVTSLCVCEPDVVTVFPDDAAGGRTLLGLERPTFFDLFYPHSLAMQQEGLI